MANPNYHLPLTNAKAILDAGLTDTIVVIEQNPEMQMPDKGKLVALFLENRVPDPSQPMAAGQRNRFYVTMSAWVCGYSGKDYEEASSVRDNLLGEVELLLMANRRLIHPVNASIACEASDLQGGKFLNAYGGDVGIPVWAALAEIRVRMQMSAITT